MKKINWKILNLAFWTELVLSYLLPFKEVDGFQYQAGFPMAFLSVYHTKLGKSPFMSMHLNPVGILVDIGIIYLVILAGIKICRRVKGIRRHGSECIMKQVE